MTTNTDMPEGYVDTQGLPRWAVFMYLFNSTQPVGMGWLAAKEAGIEWRFLDREKANKLIDERKEQLGKYEKGEGWAMWDYCLGRPLKLDLADQRWFRPALYDRYAPVSAREVIENLRKDIASGKLDISEPKTVTAQAEEVP